MNEPQGRAADAAVLPFLRAQWYVAAWSHELPAGQLLARTLLGEPLVLWRTAEGRIAALEDRCAHRQAPLSRGSLRADGTLRCGYHGLCFRADGACTEVPALAAVPPGLGVRAYPVVEHRHWVMVWMGPADQADATLLPDNFSCDSPLWRYRPGYVHYEAPFALIADNLLDFSHLSYVHAATFGGGGDEGVARAVPQLERGVDRVRITRHVRGVPQPAYHHPLWRHEGLVDRWLDYEFVLPATLLMHSGGQPTGIGADEAERAGIGVRFHSCQALTPETATSTHYFFMEAHRSDRGDASVTDALHAGLLAAFEEDRATITAQWHNLQRAAVRPMRALAMDAALVHWRRIHTEAAARENQRIES